MAKDKILKLDDNEVDEMIALLDGCLGTSESDEFNNVFKPIMKRLQKLQKGKVAKVRIYK